MTSILRLSLLATLAWLLWLLALSQPGRAQSLASQYGLETVVLRGMQAPDTRPGTQFVFFSAPALNDVGEISFSATIVGGTFPSGVWSTSGGNLHLVASEGSEAPGFAPGIRFKNFNTSVYPITINNAGETTFYNSVNTAQLNNGLWTDAGGNLQATAISRTPAVGLGPNVNLGFINGLNISQAGAVAFETTLTGSAVTPSNDRSIWSGKSPETLGLVARESNAAPGVPAGSMFDNFYAAGSGPGINTAGDVAFLGYFRGPLASASANTGIWSGKSESELRLVALSGQQAPGLPAGVNLANFEQIDEPTINGHGEVAFRGQTTGPGSVPGLSSGIWSETGGAGLRLIAKKGDIAPGASGVRFGELGKPVINNHGATAFNASLEGVGNDFAPDDGIWLDRSDEGLRLIARAGQDAPGAGGAAFDILAAPAINALGQVAFYATLTGAGVNGNNGAGLWFENAPGHLLLVVRSGDSIEIDPGVFKTVSSAFHFPSTGEDDGRQRLFNDEGQMAFQLRFNDGSAGIFIFVPEPSSLMLAAMSAITLLALVGKSRARR